MLENPDVNPNVYTNLVLVILSGERAAHPTNGTGNLKPIYKSRNCTINFTQNQYKINLDYKMITSTECMRDSLCHWFGDDFIAKKPKVE